MKPFQIFILFVTCTGIAGTSLGNAGPVDYAPSEDSNQMKEDHPKYEFIKPIKGRRRLYTAATAKIIDLRGVKPGTEFRHPHTGVIYVLPVDANAPIYPLRQ